MGEKTRIRCALAFMGDVSGFVGSCVIVCLVCLGLLCLGLSLSLSLARSLSHTLSLSLYLSPSLLVSYSRIYFLSFLIYAAEKNLCIRVRLSCMQYSYAFRVSMPDNPH
jgi:hypothetical protein